MLVVQNYVLYKLIRFMSVIRVIASVPALFHP